MEQFIPSKQPGLLTFADIYLKPKTNNVFINTLKDFCKLYPIVYIKNEFTIHNTLYKKGKYQYTLYYFPVDEFNFLASSASLDHLKKIIDNLITCKQTQLH